MKQIDSFSHLGRRAVTSFGLISDPHSTVNGDRNDVIKDRCRRYATQAINVQPTPDGAPVKPFSEIPGPKGLPFIGTFWDYKKADGYRFNKMFEVNQIRSKEFGPIFKETIGNKTFVTITDLDEYAKVVKVDGKLPNRRELECFVHYNKKRKMGLGLVNSQGEDWYRLRTVLIRKMLPLPEVQKYVDAHDLVATDFVNRLRHLQSSSRDNVVHDLEHEVFKWVLESIGCLVFDERIGCFGDPIPREALELIYHIGQTLKCTQSLLFALPFYKLYPTKDWKMFEHHLDRGYEIGQGFVNKKLEALRKQSSHGLEDGDKEEKSSFLTNLLSKPDLTPEEVNWHSLDILNASVESTASGLLWTLYCLAKNPDIQEVVFRHTDSVLPGRAPVTIDSLANLQYIKACVKEALRLYPVVYSTNRRIATDIECFGYHIPAGTVCQTNLYSIGRDDRFFPDAKRYLPERWMRGDKSESRLRTFSNLIFGHGPRMCIGRRFAEQEIYVGLTKIIQNFRLEYHGEDVEPVQQLVMQPDRPIKITFIPRI